jgi:membrane fusion protein (multidrug efflux system)
MNQTAIKLGAFILSATTASALVSCGGNAQDAQQQQAPAIEVMTVQPGDADLSSTYPATIKGKTDIEIRPQISANIVKVHVDEGQHVKAGQVLFSLDDIQLRAAVNSAQAAVNSAQAAVNTAATNEKNQKALYEKNIISQTQWQTSLDALDQARAGLRQAQESLVNARKSLSYAVVTAPSDGVIGSINYREGSLATPSMVLTTVSDNSQVYAYFSLNERDLLTLTNNGENSIDAELKNFPEVQLQLADGTIYPLKGKVATVSGVIDQTTGAATVRALFDNTNGMLRSGATGLVIIPQHSANVIVVPQKATYELQDRKYVYTVNDSNMTVATPITVLSVNDGQNYVVTEGLKAGDVVAVEGVGSTLTRPGTPIQPVTAEQKAAMEQQAAAAQQQAAQK